ncbi:uncharacterized protein LOC103524924 [Diaphorina citri]|uniref:Uncharacterized protein LOC103524924 n=1 Tax=Diaphorina citri TaxID=121845 RepID=A0A3Q0IMW4_DIACI|nr:uncharacterized protein LOC103524924 [Diaphorina citri]
MQQYYGICRQKLHWALLQLINILRPEHNTGSSPEAEVVFTLDIMEIQKTPDPRASDTMILRIEAISILLAFLTSSICKPIIRTFDLVIHYNRWSIRLEDLITEDSGNYMCLVCNSLGCIDFTFKVDIRERYPHKPYIKDGFPSNITALVNSTAIFECPPLSDLEPHLKWLKVTNVSEGEETPNGTLLQVAGWFLNSCFYSQCSILHRAKLLVGILKALSMSKSLQRETYLLVIIL